jgi:hypothetical protein
MKRLRGTHVFEARGLIDVKGKGLMPTYLLVERVSPGTAISSSGTSG